METYNKNEVLNGLSRELSIGKDLHHILHVLDAINKVHHRLVILAPDSYWYLACW